MVYEKMGKVIDGRDIILSKNRGKGREKGMGIKSKKTERKIKENERKKLRRMTVESKRRGH